MYPNLRAEMAREGIVISDLATHLDLRYATVSDKINGKFRFYYNEALEIKNNFFPKHSLEYLFEYQEKNDLTEVE
ncbi:hypothetical protein RCJ96_22935 [Bacillus sp. BSL6]